MKKQKVIYHLNRQYGKREMKARKEIPFDFKLNARLLLDELCFTWNKNALEAEINRSIDNKQVEAFFNLSYEYRQYIWE